MTFITRENHQTANTFLRYQVGVMESRQQLVPDYKWRGNVETLTGHRPGTGDKSDKIETDESPVSVFKLLGWGETREKAELRAGACKKEAK